MNTNILIVGAIIVVVLGGILVMSKPKEVGAPVAVDTSNETALGPVDDTATGSDATTNTTAPTNTTTPRPTAPAVPTTPAPAPFVATVYYDGENFVPETITVVEGGTVVFENMSDRMMWVGSDDHPTHMRYPVKSSGDCLGSSFDQCKASGRNTSWSYTFTELGEWKYHNHTRARDGGEIVVVTKEDYLKLQEKMEE